MEGGGGGPKKIERGGHEAQHTAAPNDNLTEQRQYLPGDDPRRINWKLYGHSEELFVREAEKALSPVSGIIIICDTRTQKKDKQAVADRVCERGLRYAHSVVYAASAAAPESPAAVTLYYRTGGGRGGYRIAAGHRGSGAAARRRRGQVKPNCTNSLRIRTP